jgi:hypothetical protein
VLLCHLGKVNSLAAHMAVYQLVSSSLRCEVCCASWCCCGCSVHLQVCAVLHQPPDQCRWGGARGQGR